MNAVSMSTKSLRDILRRKDLGFRVCLAEDIPGPGGGAFIRASTPLTERHLAWLEERNPARGPTYLEVLFVQEKPSGSLPAEVERQAQPPDAVAGRRARAHERARQVVSGASDVFREAGEVFRLVGPKAFTQSALRNKKVQNKLQELNDRILHFHQAVRTALEEYLEGNTLIMDLISHFDLGSRQVQHGLDVAVLAAETASRAVLHGQVEGPGDEELKKELAEVFLGGFMHDCGLWGEAGAGEEGHELRSARIAHALPALADFAPDLGKILLFHSDVLRLATRGSAAYIVERPREPRRLSFKAEFYRTVEDARTALRLRGGEFQAQVLEEADLRKVLPVAMAEYYLTHIEGFEAQPVQEVVGRLAEPARQSLYTHYVVALCNSRPEVVAPRRAYVELQGHIATLSPTHQPESVDLGGYSGASIGHFNDLYSPHLVLLFSPGEDGSRQKLAYVAPQDGALWGRQARPGHRLYLAAGRHRNTLSFKVTGFMDEDVYANLLGEYELELKRQML